MGIFSRLFGKKQPPVPEAPPAAKDMADASVKDVVRHVFDELARGLSRKNTDDYIDLVEKTMFKRG